MKIIVVILKAFLGTMLILFLIALLPKQAPTHSAQSSGNLSRYAETWTDYPTKPISMTLAHAQARGCACYDYKQEKTSNSEFLVRCGCDPSEYRFYTVWTAIDKVIGPYSKETEAP